MHMGSIPRLTVHRSPALKGWIGLAAGSLAVAGALALLLAASRTPKVQDLLPWGPEFFHKGLVTHVVFSFQVWLLASLGALATQALGRRGEAVSRAGLALSALGAALLLVPTLAGWGEASMNNYVPVLVHPLFFAGLGLIGAGIALPSAAMLIWASREPFPFAVSCAGAATLSALACFALAALQEPSVERLFWGGGHVLQFANTLMLMAGWLELSRLGPGVPALPPLTARACAAAVVLFAVAAPLLYRLDVSGLAHRQAFTQLLWWGLPLPPLVMGLGAARALIRAPREAWRGTATLALALSLAVFALGGVSGFFLGVADTRTPSHYHAVIGGVNLALMGLMATSLLGMAATRALRWSFILYGGGQLVHALGFFLAGAAGVPRKAAGAEQVLDTAYKKAAMGVVGLGAGIAVIGGVLFLVLLLREVRRA
jgi:hypothetical protein